VSSIPIHHICNVRLLYQSNIVMYFLRHVLLISTFFFHFAVIWYCYREDYYQEGNHVHARLKVLDAYTRALTTWAKWVDRKINANQTQVFFRGYSVTHFWYCSLLHSFHNSIVCIRTCYCFLTFTWIQELIEACF